MDQGLGDYFLLCPSGGLQPGLTHLCQKVDMEERWVEREEPRTAAGSGLSVPCMFHRGSQDEGRYPFGSLATPQLYTQACLFPYKTIFLFYTKNTPPLPRMSPPYPWGTSPSRMGLRPNPFGHSFCLCWLDQLNSRENK